MEILGVGPSEFVFIIVIAIIVLGPNRMQEAGRTVGHWMNRFVKSDAGKFFNDLSDLPRKLMKDANMEVWKAEQDLQHSIDPRAHKPKQSPMPSQPKQASYRKPAPQQNRPDEAPASNVEKKDATTPND